MTRGFRRGAAALLAAVMLAAAASPVLADTSQIGLVEVTADHCADQVLADPIDGPLQCATGTQNRAVGHAQGHIDGALGVSDANLQRALTLNVGDELGALVREIVAQVATLGNLDVGVDANSASLEVGLSVDGLGVNERVAVSPAGVDTGLATNTDTVTTMSTPHTVNMRPIGAPGFDITPAKTNNRLSGSMRFQVFASELNTPNAARWWGTHHLMSITPRNGGQIAYMETQAQPDSDIWMASWDPGQVTPWHGGTDTLGVEAGVERGISARIGMSRSWNRPEGHSGGGALHGNTHYALWTGRSSWARETSGLTMWRTPEGVPARWRYVGFWQWYN